jgi:hypothetical protein
MFQLGIHPRRLLNVMERIIIIPRRGDRQFLVPFPNHR